MAKEKLLYLDVDNNIREGGYGAVIVRVMKKGEITPVLAFSYSEETKTVVFNSPLGYKTSVFQMNLRFDTKDGPVAFHAFVGRDDMVEFKRVQ